MPISFSTDNNHADDDDNDDTSLNRLQGTANTPQSGGLIVFKKPPSTSATDEPRVSLLGLDRLAAEKRAGMVTPCLRIAHRVFHLFRTQGS
jgi:hypothetical protein